MHLFYCGMTWKKSLLLNTYLRFPLNNFIFCSHFLFVHFLSWNIGRHHFCSLRRYWFILLNLLAHALVLPFICWTFLGQQTIPFVFSSINPWFKFFLFVFCLHLIRIASFFSVFFRNNKCRRQKRSDGNKTKKKKTEKSFAKMSSTLI